VESENGLFSEMSESRLRNTVLSTLHGKGYLQHRVLEITVNQDTVTVEGVVPAWHLRQIALECIRRVPGVVRVVDQIRVVAGASDETPLSDGAVTNRDADSATTESVSHRVTGLNTRQLEAEHVDSLLNPWFVATDEAADRERHTQTACS
jgi:hypothetical protein